MWPVVLAAVAIVGFILAFAVIAPAVLPIVLAAVAVVVIIFAGAMIAPVVPSMSSSILFILEGLAVVLGIVFMVAANWRRLTEDP
jgi:hypothetical protein